MSLLVTSWWKTVLFVYFVSFSAESIRVWNSQRWLESDYYKFQWWSHSPQSWPDQNFMQLRTVSSVLRNEQFQDWFHTQFHCFVVFLMFHYSEGLVRVSWRKVKNQRKRWTLPWWCPTWSSIFDRPRLKKFLVSFSNED